MSRPELPPYLGSRPFERTEQDRRRFFGRDRETEELSALILSHNLVLVYAASGVGKSSLLDAGVVPDLVEEGFEVLPRGRIGILFPIDEALDGDANPYVINLLCSLSPEADVRSMLDWPLADYLRRLPRQPGSAGRVMVIDQAEELFTFTPKDWQVRQRGFFVALRDALRDDPDLRIVIVAREDYLARFDDLAPILPDGMRVRLRIEALRRDAALQAVKGPLAGTGRRFDDGVAEQLIGDLSKTKIAMTSGTREEPGPHVEPVQLQIVCSALWNKVPDDVEVITEEHLHAFGDVEETLERFYADTVHDCVSATQYDRERLVRWFGDKLITPSDTRGQVFQGPLTTEGLPNHVVAFLESRHLLRADERASGRWYELAHDRLIRPIRTVNEGWDRTFAAARARRQARRRIARWAAATVGAAVVVGGVATALSVQAHRRDVELAKTSAREYELAVRPIEDLRAECSKRSPTCAPKTVRVFDFLTDYYWRQAKVDELVERLKGASDLIPVDYGMVLSTSPEVSDEVSQPGILRIKYNPERQIGEWRMRAEWAQMAAKVGEMWGLPVSPAISLITDARVSLQSIHVEARPKSCMEVPSEVSLSLTMPSRAGEAVVSRSDIEKDPRLGAFFQKYSAADHWQEYKGLKLGGPWWFVPAWTLPVWRVGGQPAVSPEAVLAVVLANGVVDHPEIALSCDALRAVLRKANQVAPETVSEAISARTLEGLRNDLIEIVREHRTALTNPSMILDALANYPGVSSDQAAKQADEELQSQFGHQDSLHGPWPKRAATSLEQPGARDLEKQLSQNNDCRKEPLVLEMGAALKPVFVDSQNILNESVRLRLQQLRGAVYQRFGVLFPGVRFRELEGDGIKITVLNQDNEHPLTQELTVTASNALERSFDELEQRAHDFRVWWVTAEQIALALDMLRPEERAWIDHHYSLTDLKQLARATISSEEDSDDAATLRDLPWLLRSLTFWGSAFGVTDIADLAGSLRATQRASRQRPGPATRGGDRRSAALVRRGLIALDAGRARAAATKFARALRRDRSAAIEAFLSGYGMLSSLGPARRTNTLLAACSIDGSGTLSKVSPTITYEIDDVLASGTETMPSAVRRRLELCRTDPLAELQTPQEMQNRLSSLLEEVPIEEWSDDEALFLARRWLTANYQATTPPAEVEKLKRLFLRGFSHRAHGQLLIAWKAMQEGVGQSPWRWVRDLIADVASQLPPEPLGLRWWIAEWLNEFGELEAQRALGLIDGLDARMTTREHWVLNLIRAEINIHLGDYGDEAQRAKRFDDAARLLHDLLRTQPDPELAVHAARSLVDAHIRRGDVVNAKQTIAEATGLLRDTKHFDDLTFWLEIASGAESKAREVAARIARRDKTDITSLFVNAVLATLTRSEDFDAAARAFIFHDEKNPHPYADYIRLLLFWALSETGRDDVAKRLLDDRMRTVRIDAWPARLQQRDTMVWREMLVAYFAGAIPDADIFDPLRDDASFRASSLHQTELALDGLRCEAYFYSALRERVQGPAESRDKRYRAKLELVLATKQYAYLEYRMAQFLLARHES
jgi:hypothetical protein